MADLMSPLGSVMFGISITGELSNDGSSIKLGPVTSPFHFEFVCIF